ncbi:MAG TPA: Tim44/TimA family putative adaptor protein [Rhizomicrobium sp.]|nr:Tim44/TimA family putative adaptor protein [Rhizomicrobium sp.]
MANSQLLEILLLAMVAGVILFRLYTVLGRRTGHEPRQEPSRVSAPAEQAADKPAIGALPAARTADLPADPVARGLMEIKLADRSFDQEHFLTGARHAYELILTAFSANDRAALKPLLSDEVYAAFDAAMRGREERKEKVSFTFVGFKDSKIVEATLNGKTADIAVAFTAQFISATTDANDAVVDGDPKSVREVTDIWAFARNVRASDPNWTLVHTSGAEPSA